MKIGAKRLVRDESGQALILALVLLLVSGLIAAPLLAFTGNGLLTGEVYGKRTAELYAADAGVENALWRIQHGDLVLCPGNPPYNYTIPDVNGKSVGITVTSINDFEGVSNLTGTYRIESTAMGDASGTAIDAYIDGLNKYGDYGDLLGQVLTSEHEIDFPPHWEDLIYPSEGENGPLENYDDDWPTADELMDFYLDDVKDGTRYYSDTVVDIAGIDRELGPLYVEGELTIKNSSATPATLTLTGTIYSTEKTSIAYGTSENQPMTLDLNDQTIFVASNSTGNGQEALKIGDKCTLVGSGSIIAIGDIYFKPQTEAGVTDPVFVFSVSGTTQVQPNGDFFGSIAGSVEIDLQPGTTINYPESAGWYDNLNFLIGVKKLVYSIDSWEVNQQ